MNVTNHKIKSTVATVRSGYLPDGIFIEEITVYSNHDEITRLGVLMDLAGFKMIDRKNDSLQPSKDVAMFRKETN